MIKVYISYFGIWVGKRIFVSIKSIYKYDNRIVRFYIFIYNDMLLYQYAVKTTCKSSSCRDNCDDRNLQNKYHTL